MCCLKFCGCLPLAQERYKDTTGMIRPLHTEKYRDALISVLFGKEDHVVHFWVKGEAPLPKGSNSQASEISASSSNLLACGPSGPSHFSLMVGRLWRFGYWLQIKFWGWILSANVWKLTLCPPAILLLMQRKDGRLDFFKVETCLWYWDKCTFISEWLTTLWI